MTQTSSLTDCDDTSLLDPSKHVNFVQGMVLGVSEFQQEFAWSAARHAMIARDLVGYGTVSGLRLSVDPSDVPSATPSIAVDPGIAVTPRGEFVSVTRRQCAGIPDWLNRAENRTQLAAVAEDLGAPPARYARVFVRLRYRECLTDDVPLPGQPCRTEEEAMASSRIADSWQLQLSFDAPAQREEDAVRLLVHWLRQIPIVEHPGASPDELVAALRAAAASALSSDAVPLELELTNPPPELVIGQSNLCECLRAALGVWTTELRWRVQDPFLLSGGGCGCDGPSTGSPPASSGPERDVLLAEVWVPVRDAVGGGVEFDPARTLKLHEEKRPYLLQLRLLQELVTCGAESQETVTSTFASVLATSADSFVLWIHYPDSLELSRPNALSVTVNDLERQFSTEPGPTPNVFEVRFTDSPPAALVKGDRIQVTFDVDAIALTAPEGSPDLTLRTALDETMGTYLDYADGTLVVRGIVGLLVLDDLVDVAAATPQDGEVLMFGEGQWRPKPIELTLDDLTDVDSSAERGGDVLWFDEENGQWTPRPLSLDDLSDVEASEPHDGDVLQFVRTGEGDSDEGAWQPSAFTLDALSDVEASEPNDGNVLVFVEQEEGDGGTWQPTSLALDGLSDVEVQDPTEGEVLRFLPNDQNEGAIWQASPFTLDALSDVEASAPEPGAVLRFETGEGRDGTWQPSSLVLEDLTDVNVVGATDGQVLTKSGDGWTAANVAVGSAMEVNSGLVFIKGLAAKAAGLYGPFAHGFEKRFVMMRLGFELPNGVTQLAEDTDTSFPAVVVVTAKEDPNFMIGIRDQRPEGPPQDYYVRWFAIPITKRFDSDDKNPPAAPRARLTKGDGSGFALVTGAVLAEISAGVLKVPLLEQRFSVQKGELGEVLKALMDQGAIKKIDNEGNITLGKRADQ